MMSHVRKFPQPIPTLPGIGQVDSYMSANCAAAPGFEQPLSLRELLSLMSLGLDPVSGAVMALSGTSENLPSTTQLKEKYSKENSF